MSTQQLYAEVRVNAARIKPADTPSNQAKALTDEPNSNKQFTLSIPKI
jgi:hypothetical protein